MHFCAGLPIILVGCKKDLRRDPRVIEELRKTSQRPVTPEEVSCPLSFCIHTPPHPTSLPPPPAHPASLTVPFMRCVAGHGSSPEDRCEALPRVFRQIRRGRPRSLPIRDAGGAPQPVQDREEAPLHRVVIAMTNPILRLSFIHPIIHTLRATSATSFFFSFFSLFLFLLFCLVVIAN